VNTLPSSKVNPLPGAVVIIVLSKGVLVVRDDDQDSTDLMKCLRSLQEKEEADGVDVGVPILATVPSELEVF
jgi:hypothetical protein